MAEVSMGGLDGRGDTTSSSAAVHWQLSSFAEGPKTPQLPSRHPSSLPSGSSVRRSSGGQQEPSRRGSQKHDDTFMIQLVIASSSLRPTTTWRESIKRKVLEHGATHKYIICQVLCMVSSGRTLGRAGITIAENKE